MDSIICFKILFYFIDSYRDGGALDLIKKSMDKNQENLFLP